MTNYKCNRCNKLYSHKGDYTKHLNRKIPCKTISPIIVSNLVQDSPNQNKKFKCSKCSKTFANKSNLNRHTSRSCKAKLEFKKEYTNRNVKVI